MNALVIAALLASAEQPERLATLVSVQAPNEWCETGLFERELVLRTDRVRLVEAASAEAPADAVVEVKVVQKGRRFDGQLKVLLRGLSTSRRFGASKCSTVIGALSLAAALVLDPKGAKAVLPPTLPEVVEPVAVTTPTPPPQPLQPPSPEPTPTQPPAPAAVAEAPPPAPAEPPAGLTAHVSVLALGAVNTAIGNQADFGGGAAMLLSLEPAPSRLAATIGLSAAAMSGRAVSNALGAVEYLPHAQFQLEAGAALKVGALVPELGAAAQLTPVVLQGLSADENVSTQRWLWAIGPYARLTVQLPARFVLSGQALAGANLRREQYVIERSGEVMRVPAWYVAAALCIGWAVF